MKLSIIACLLSLSCFASHPLEDLTLEEKVGQILIGYFNGETVNADAKTLIENTHIGGMLYYNWANGLTSPEQVSQLSSDLQAIAKIPLFIAIDQEGGLVSRLTKGFTVFPGNRALGVTGDSQLAEESAFATGQELQNVGINMNLAPVVDINNNPYNPILSIRCFGDSPEIVTSFARRALIGYHRAGIITSLKHFPGHGDVTINSHEGLPILKKSKEQLRLKEFIPFASLAQETDTIMTGHLMLPSIDPNYCATLSKIILDIPRKEMGFEGLILSDSLIMEGLLKNGLSIEETAIQAFNAGCDVLILGGKQMLGTTIGYELTVKDIQNIHLSLLEAVKNGRISETRLNESVERILALKTKYGILPRTNHKDLAKKIATLALQVKKKPSISFGPLNEKKLAIFGHAINRESVIQTPLLTLGKNNISLFFKTLLPSEEEIRIAHTMIQKSDIIVFCSYNAWQNPSQIALITSLTKMKKPLILITLRDPLDASLFPMADLIITTFSPTQPSIQAVYEYLKTY